MCVDACSDRFKGADTPVEGRDSTGASAGNCPAHDPAWEGRVKEEAETANTDCRQRVLLAVRADVEDSTPLTEASGKQPADSAALLVKLKEAENTSEPASSKDTTTLDQRSHSPRKSVGTLSQEKIRLELGHQSKGSDAEDVSLSSLSGLGKAVDRISVGICTPRARAESDVSNHSSRLRHTLEDLHEADSHSALRGNETGPRSGTAATCSASDDAGHRNGQEEINSRCPSEDRNLASQSEAARPECSHSPPMAANCSPRTVQELATIGAKRLREFDPDEDVAGISGRIEKVETGSESPDYQSPCAVPSVFTTDAAAAEERRTTKSARRGSQRDEEAYSRACSAALQDEDAEEETPSTPRRPLRKQPRGKSGRKAPAGLTQRRSTRVAAVDSQADCAEIDEDYLPPGEAAEAFGTSAATPKIVRSTRTRSASLPKPCIASSTAALAGSGSATRSNSNRLRWGSGPGFSMGAPLTSPTGSRRLRSQPLDVSSLVPDPFAFEPPAKRTKHSALLSGMQGLRQLEEKSSTRLTKSGKSGILKPYPAWQQLSEEAILAVSVEAGLKQSREAQRSDFKLLDGQPARPAAELEALADRLGPARMCKALFASAKVEADETAQCALEDGTEGLFNKACKALMPSAMRSVCEAWSQRLEAPCVGVLGEPTTCLKARCDRDIQNTWDDLLSRHALETQVLESLSSWLFPEVRVEKADNGS